MRFRFNPPNTDRHLWFAWHPVLARDPAEKRLCWVWLERVWRWWDDNDVPIECRTYEYEAVEAEPKPGMSTLPIIVLSVMLLSLMWGCTTALSYAQWQAKRVCAKEDVQCMERMTAHFYAEEMRAQEARANGIGLMGLGLGIMSTQQPVVQPSTRLRANCTTIGNNTNCW